MLVRNKDGDILNFYKVEPEKVIKGFDNICFLANCGITIKAIYNNDHRYYRANIGLSEKHFQIIRKAFKLHAGVNLNYPTLPTPYKASWYVKEELKAKQTQLEQDEANLEISFYEEEDRSGHLWDELIQIEVD